MKRTLITLLTLIALSAVNIYAETVEEIYFVVNGDIITKMDFDEQMRLSADFASKVGQGEPAKNDIVSNMIYNILVKQEAENNGISLSGIDITNQIKWQIKKWNLSSIDELIMVLPSQGMTYEYFYNNMQNQLLREQLMGRLVTVSEPTTDEVKNFYDKNKEKDFKVDGRLLEISRIFFRKMEGMSFGKLLKLQKQAEEVHKKITGGTDFQEVMESFGEDDEMIIAGNMGWVTEDLLQDDPKVYEAVKTMKKGEVSEVITGVMGFYIIKITGVKKTGYLPFESASMQIKEYLIREKKEKALLKRIDTFRDKSVIEKKTSFFGDYEF